MKHIKTQISLSFLVAISCTAEAASYCNLLWANNSLPSASLNVSFDGNTTGSFPLKLQAGGISTVIRRYSENMTKFITLDGIVRYWIQYPEEWQTTPEGLKYRITSGLNESLNQTPGVKTVVTPEAISTWSNTYGCIEQGGTYDFGISSIDGINIEIDRGTAWPGVYTLSLPIKVGYEENKGNYSGNNGGGWQEYSNAMKSFTPIESKGVMVTISSKCDIENKDININMGDNITPQNAITGVEKEVNVSLRCNSLAKVSLSLKGVDVVDGISNKTKCGSGSCILTFDNNMKDKTIDVNNGLYQVPISVLFQDYNASAGAFNGSAILSVDVQ